MTLQGNRADRFIFDDLPLPIAGVMRYYGNGAWDSLNGDIEITTYGAHGLAVGEWVTLVEGPTTGGTYVVDHVDDIRRCHVTAVTPDPTKPEPRNRHEKRRAMSRRYHLNEANRTTPWRTR